MIRENIEWDIARQEFLTSEPFNHVIIDDFWQADIADQLYAEFPKYDDDKVWNGVYANAIENKKTCNFWDRFPKTTYKAFNFLGSDWLTDKIRFVSNRKDLSLDFGLHGGGWHAHANGGNLNLHLDYNIHPKLGEQRKLNIIIYMTPEWNNAWGGGLELWTHDPETKRPKTLDKLVDNVYNRAVIFDTTQNSWHGLPHEIQCPEDKSRNSLAIYYLSEAQSGAEQHTKALFAPTKEQEGDVQIYDFIKQRAGLK